MDVVLEDLGALLWMVGWLLRIVVTAIAEVFVYVLFCGPAAGLTWLGLWMIRSAREKRGMARDGACVEGQPVLPMPRKSLKDVAVTWALGGLVVLFYLLILHVSLLWARSGIEMAKEWPRSGAVEFLQEIQPEDDY